jgi:hypothetical protein
MLTLLACGLLAGPTLADDAASASGASGAEATSGTTPPAAPAATPGAPASDEGRIRGGRRPDDASAPRPRVPMGEQQKGVARPGTGEVQVPAEVRQAILGNELFGRLRTVSRTTRLTGTAPGGGRWTRDALGEGPTVPVTVSFGRGVLRTMALRSGARVWLGAGHLNEPAAILRLGDLLPLLSTLGIDDREAALSVTEISFAGGSTPPGYTMAFRTGALWPHRHVLASAEARGRVTYSLVTGRLTVMGALVVADAEGNLRVRNVSHEGEMAARFKSLIMPVECQPLEAALRSDDPTSAVPHALELLEKPAVTQACAARYLALARPEGAADRLRALLGSGQVARPGDVVAALVHLEPSPTEENIAAVVRLVDRNGVPGAEGVCVQAPLMWSDILLDRPDVAEPNKRVIRRCLRQ